MSTRVFSSPNDAQGTSVEPLVSAGSLDSQFEAFRRVVAQHPTLWDPSMCTKAAFAKGVNWVSASSRADSRWATPRGTTAVQQCTARPPALLSVRFSGMQTRCPDVSCFSCTRCCHKQYHPGNHRTWKIPSMLSVAVCLLYNVHLCAFAEERAIRHCILLHLAPYLSAMSQVRSRGFTVLGDPHMIPGADMFNHDPNKQSVQIGTDGDDHFVMKTVSIRRKSFANVS